MAGLGDTDSMEVGEVEEGRSWGGPRRGCPTAIWGDNVTMHVCAGLVETISGIRSTGFDYRTFWPLHRRRKCQCRVSDTFHDYFSMYK